MHNFPVRDNKVLLYCIVLYYCIIFTICTIACQAISSTPPVYLNLMLTPARNSRQLCSTSSNPLYIPRVKTKAGTRAFSVAAPTVWNSLPARVKSEGNNSSSIDDSCIVLRLRVHLIRWFCRATELDLQGYWRIRSHYYYF